MKKVFILGIFCFPLLIGCTNVDATRYADGKRFMFDFIPDNYKAPIMPVLSTSIGEC